MSKAILYDSTLCIGCKSCESGCAERWGLPYNDKIAAEETISAHKLTAVETHGEHYSRRLCMNCQQPACASVCPVGALQKTALGPVVYDADKCMGCRGNPRRTLQPAVVHELPTTGVRFGVSGRRAPKDGPWAGGLRRGQVHGLPLLYAGMPVPGPLLRVGQAPAQDAQVRYVLRAANPGQADGVRRSLSGGRHGVRRPR